MWAKGNLSSLIEQGLVDEAYLAGISPSTIFVTTTLFSGLDAQTDNPLLEEQLYRPNYHFTPQNGWMNDPNGLFYLDGTYHLFFQHTPFQSVPDFSKMHWGQAISKDLIKWEELTPAIPYDEKGAIFSGSAVVDKDNTSGFGNGKNVPVVAIFTYHNMEKEKAGEIDAQSQAIAYSLDKGKTWITK